MEIIEDDEVAVATEIAPTEPPDILSYDRYLVGFSGGKDSVISFFRLLEAGVPRSKIELHHHLVDGRESELMDWPVTESYCRAFAEAFGVKIYMSWRVGGIEREMLRDLSRTAPVSFDSEKGFVKTLGGDRGGESTRLKFPQTSADLKVRWCSSVVKIDVFARILTNEPRFQSTRTLVVTGERAEESTARGNYLQFEPHRSDLRNGVKIQRHIDHWRPVHQMLETEVWAMMERYKVNPHPAYWLGWSRLSCRTCVFLGPDEWATMRTYMPKAFNGVATYERQFKITIHRTRTVDEQADRGIAFPCKFEILQLAESKEYYHSIIVEKWTLPPGAFKHGRS